MKIPSDNQWTQSNRGDIFGVLHETQNVTFDDQGKLMLSKKPFALYQPSSNFGYVLRFVYFNDNYIAISDDEAYQFDLNSSTFTAITSNPNFTNSTDAELFNEKMYVTIDNNVSKWDGSSWTNSLNTLTSGVPHPLALHEGLNYLCVGNGNTVEAMNTSDSVAITLTLPSPYQVTTMRYRNGFVYIGTRHIYGGEAKVFIWDGATTGADYDVPVGAPWVFSITEYAQSVVCLTSEGEMLLISGNSAQQVATFPVYHRPDLKWQDSSGLQLNGKCFNRGMITVGRKIYINIDGGVDTGFMPEMKSGLWVFDPDVGLYHRAASGADKVVYDSSLTVSSNEITTSAAHNLKTGDSVNFSVVDGITGINNGVTYYVEATATTKIKLYRSRQEILNGNPVTLGGTPNTDELVYVPNTDAGTLNAHAAGAIGRVVYNADQFPNWTSDVIWASRSYDNTETQKYSIHGLVDSYNSGWAMTQRIYTPNVKQVWHTLYTFVDYLDFENEKLRIAYKTSKDENKPTDEISGTWLNSTTLNVVVSSNDQSSPNEINVGDILFIRRGAGQGNVVKVTAKNGTSTVSLTVDTAIGTTGATCDFNADNFKVIEAKTATSAVNKVLQATINAKSDWVQLLVLMDGFQTAVKMFELTNDVDKYAV